jgi:hypothetical protein
MPAIHRLSLHTALEALRAECVMRLAEEYPDQQIELRPVPFASPPALHQCWLDGRSFGEPVDLERVLGHALGAGREAAVRAVVEPLSEALMLHLQTAM